MNYTSTFLIAITVSLLFSSCAKEQPRGMILDWVKATAIPDSVITSPSVNNSIYPTLDEGEVSLAESKVFQNTFITFSGSTILPLLMDQPANYFVSKEYLDFNTDYTLGIFNQYPSSAPNFKHDFIANFLITSSAIFNGGESTVQFQKDALRITVGVRWIY